MFTLRLAVQLPLYFADELVALGVAKTAMGFPVFALAAWLVPGPSRGRLAAQPPAVLSLCSPVKAESAGQRARAAHAALGGGVPVGARDAVVSGGAARAGTDSAVRTPFQRDRDRIVHSKAFRRLKHKTQVFIAAEGDHYRTRLTHTLETCQIARTVARALGLNEDLTEAIGLGHDLGHPPFGHIGEEALDEALEERRAGFRTTSSHFGWSTCSSVTGRG